jgi:hypothetical protein
MLRFDWDVLRVGDGVLLHDADKADLALVSGVVAMVITRKGSNGIGIRVGSTTGDLIMWPARLAVHLDPRDPTEECWRCQALAGRGMAGGLKASEGAAALDGDAIGVQPEGALV